MANEEKGTLYIGVTNDIIRRIFEHKMGIVDGFTKRYKINRLVYFEQTEDIYSAIVREKQLKKWRREWKFNIIERDNPHWEDLYVHMIGKVDAGMNPA